MATYDLTVAIPSKIVTGDILNCPYSGAYKSLTLPKGNISWNAGAHRADIAAAQLTVVKVDIPLVR